MRPPQDITAERATLGSLFLRPELTAIVEEILPIEAAFFELKNQVTFKALRIMARAGRPIDWLSVSSEIVRQGTVGHFGSKLRCEMYLEEITRETPDSAGWEEYAKAVREAWLRRTLIDKMREIAMEAGQPDKDMLAAIGRLQRDSKTLLTIADYVPPVLIADAAEDVINQLADRKQDIEEQGEGGMVGLSYGWPEVDLLTGGMRRGDWIVIAGRPGGGKTTAGLNIAEHTADTCLERLGSDKGGAYVICFDMSATELAEVVLAGRAQVDSLKIRTAKTIDAEDIRLEKEQLRLKGKRLWIDTPISLTWSQVRARVLIARERYGVELVVVDYLQKIKKDDKRMEQQQHVAEMAQGMKALARELDIPIISMAQMNRAIELRRGKKAIPVMGDIRDSGFIEQEANVVIMLHPKPNDQDRITGITATDFVLPKVRGGKGQTEVPMEFDKPLGRFRAAQPKPEGYVDVSAFSSYYEIAEQRKEEALAATKQPLPPGGTGPAAQPGKAPAQKQAKFKTSEGAKPGTGATQGAAGGAAQQGQPDGKTPPAGAQPS